MKHLQPNKRQTILITNGSVKVDSIFQLKPKSINFLIIPNTDVTDMEFLVLRILFIVLYRYEIDVERFPTIFRIEKNLQMLEPFVKTHPSRQSDCPPGFTGY